MKSFVDFYHNVAKPFVAASHQGYFNTSPGPSGAWPDWEFRSAKAPEEHKTLIVSQRLAFSMQPDGPDNVLKVDETEMVYGTAVEYAPIHNYGATIRTGIPLYRRGSGTYLPEGSMLTIPPREFIGLTDTHIDELAELCADWILEQAEDE